MTQLCRQISGPYWFPSPGTGKGELRMIHQLLHQNRQQNTGNHIQYGMLLQKHGRQDNGNHEKEGTSANPFVLSQLLIIDNRNMRPKGIVHMQAWKNIRCRVRPVQNRDGKGKNIVPLKGCGSKQMPIGVNGGYHQKQRHSRKQKNTALIKFPLIFQLENK